VNTASGTATPPCGPTRRISATMVAEIRRVGPHGGVAVPLAVFTDLVAGGMGVDAAWRSVAELANRGGDDQAFLDLRDRLRPAMTSP